MAHFIIVLATFASAAYVACWLIDCFITARRAAAKAREWGCKDPKEEVVPGLGPLASVRRVRQALQADKEKLFPDWLMSRAEAMGVWTWQYRLFGSKLIMTNEPQNLQAILATQFGTFDLGPERRSMFWPMLGNGIFTQSAGEWKHSREMMRPQFTRDQVSDLDLEERHVQNLMRALDAKLAPSSGSGSGDGAPGAPGAWSQVVDMQDLFFRLTLDSATEFLLGESADSQLQHIPGYAAAREKRDASDALHGSNFAWAFDRGQLALATRVRFGNLHWLYNTSEFRECVRQCNGFMDHYVRKALGKAPQEKEKEKEKEKDVEVSSSSTKSKYVFMDALADKTRDPVELRSQTMHVLLAGRDTTASMLGWLFMLLSQDPARYKKLRDVVVAEFGTYEQPRDITFARLKSCQYLQHCNNETLRLFPVVPVNARWAFKDTTLPVGGGPDGKSPIFVRKGTSVEYSVHLLHRRKDIWGPDADEFVPERWENRKVGWEYLPFNGGPRICLGQQFALTEASYVTVRLLQRFEAIQNKETDKTVRHNLTLTTCSANGVKICLRTADA